MAELLDGETMDTVIWSKAVKGAKWDPKKTLRGDVIDSVDARLHFSADES